MWVRVFGTTDSQPEPTAVLEVLQGIDPRARAQFRRDDQGWFEAEVSVGDGPSFFRVQCYRADEEGIRGELSAWAAWLETADDQPEHARLMRHVIRTTQLFTIEAAADGPAAAWCRFLTRFLAGATDGVYQVDGEGFFDADGALLVGEKE